MKLHINQMIQDGEISTDSMEGGMLYIRVKESKSGKFFIAKEAKEYWIGENEEELEKEVELAEAIKWLAQGVPFDCQHTDSKFSIFDPKTEKLLPLVWFAVEDGKKVGQCLDVIRH